MRIAILTSGGDAPGMNAVIRSVVRTAIYNDIEVYGVTSGYEGLIDGKLNRLIESSVADIIQRGGTILGTSRSERFMTEEGFKKALNVLEVYKIDALIVCGGDGSFRGALKLQEAGVKVIAIPVSIDNDLGYTDRTIGFFTCLQTVTSAVSNIRDTTESHGRANIVEVMGRNCGDIALYAGLSSGAESIIVPEIETDYDEIAKKAIMGKNRGKKHHIIIMAEGSGDAYEFAEKFQNLTGIDTKVTILGYIQRGGTPSVEDRLLASQMGYFAVLNIIKDNTGVAIGYKEDKIILKNIRDVFNIKKEFRTDLLKILQTISI